MSFITPPPPNPTPTEPSTFRARAINLFDWITGNLVSELEAAFIWVQGIGASLTLNSTNDTSTSSVLIGTGSKSLTVSASKSYLGGMYVVIADAAAPSTNSMTAQVTSYNSGTGAMVVNVLKVVGSGTKTAWTISQCAMPSLEVSTVMQPVTSAASLAAGRSALGITPSAFDYDHVVSSATPYPYVTPAPPIDILRGDPWEKFSLTLAKVLNFTDYPNFKLNQRARAAFNSGTVRLVIVGDSISAGADNWRSNTYVTLLKTQLKQAFPWVNFVFINHAIGGMSAAHLANPSYVGAANLGAYSIGSNYWFTPNKGGACDNATYASVGYAHLDEENWPLGSTAGRSWRQQVVDSDPDIIVYAFGMNDGTNYDAFKTAYDSFQSFIASSMGANIPWFVLVSCFLPSKIPPAGQPHATWQVPAQAMADAVKYWAAQSGYGLIDANAVFNFLRDGVRREYLPYTHEANWRYAADASAWAWQGGFAYNSGTVRAGGTGMAQRQIATRDLDFSATFEISSFSANLCIGRIGYRDALAAAVGTSTGYSVDVLMNSTSTSAEIYLYYVAAVVANVSVSLGAMPIVGDKFSVKVKVYGNRHEVWLNGKLVVDVTDARSLYSNTVQVGIAQGGGYVSDLGLSYAPQWAESPTHVDKKWLLGTPTYDVSGVFQTYGDFISNPDSLGGNVVNHPTAWGHNTFYGFGISKFVQELKQRVNAPVSIYKESTASFTNTAAANTPQVVSNIPAITFKAPPSSSGSNFLVTIKIPYTIAGATGYPQFGIMLNGAHVSSNYVPQSSTLDVATLTFVINAGAGVNTVQVDCVRSALTETLTVNPVGGTVASISVQETTL